MLQIIEPDPNWPVYADVFEHPSLRLASWRPIWSEMTSVNTITQWREDWSSASVVNHTIVTDSTVRQPGFSLPRHTWSLMNRFQTGQGQCCATLHKWGLAKLLWLWPVTDHEPHCRLVLINQIWRRTESTPWSRWWRIHCIIIYMAGIYSDCCICEIIIVIYMTHSVTSSVLGAAAAAVVSACDARTLIVPMASGTRTSCCFSAKVTPSCPSGAYKKAACQMGFRSVKNYGHPLGTHKRTESAL